MVFTTFMADAEQVEALKALSAVTRVPYSAYVREGLDLLLESKRGILEAGRATIPVTDDDLDAPDGAVVEEADGL